MLGLRASTPRHLGWSAPPAAAFWAIAKHGHGGNRHPPPAAGRPALTVHDVLRQSIGAMPITGSAILYRVTIQLPATVPTGAVAVEASAGGGQTPAGVSIFVGKP